MITIFMLKVGQLITKYKKIAILVLPEGLGTFFTFFFSRKGKIFSPNTAFVHISFAGVKIIAANPLCFLDLIIHT